ncbi:hypothetical protein Halru_2677 [Halovivax ruber XH-70]|uniref:DUF302 domain-containing protein n=1 Tax=Halovivax ruber (strain DSM 18193 / JCM 13892 / XH-70) TaxID=797302 RepID=L0IEJ1_HALRX|nr:DUF302 domain-containing protein [Halovivax ruber]AGB17253.1 hypothetical protein Halru_2677 [Halovivax ruber XH-70]
MATPKPAPTVEEALHTTLDLEFEDAVAHVQLEHEYQGFETVALTRLDEYVAGVLDEEIRKTALIVVCHAEIARDALEIDPQLAGLLPCTTVVYEDDGVVHAYHASTTKAIRDLGCAPGDCGPAVEALVEQTGDVMGEVWANIEAHAENADSS